MEDKSTETDGEDLSVEENFVSKSKQKDERFKSDDLDDVQNCLRNKFKIVFVVSLFFLALSLVAVASILAWAYVEREHMMNERNGKVQSEPTRLYSSSTATLNSEYDHGFREGDFEKTESRDRTGKHRSSIPDGNENMHLYRVYDAIAKGAVCLDGTPPAYYLRPGKGLGVNRWIIHFNGGAWCFDEQSCLDRSRGSLGSTKHLPAAPPVIQGINSPSMQQNPDFYDWNLVWIVYCDGASFTGDRADPVVVSGESLFFRGKRVLDAVISDLTKRGISNAEGIILTGSSAGSMTAMFAVDRLAEQLPNVPMHVLSDAGYFIETQPMGGKNVGSMFQKIYEMQDAAGGLNQDCVAAFGAKMAWKCFLPQHTFKFIKHPVFVLNSAYDVWALLYFVGINCKFPSVSSPAAHKRRKRRSSASDAQASLIASDRRDKRDISGFEILPYFRSRLRDDKQATSTFEERTSSEDHDDKRSHVQESEGGRKKESQEKRNYEPPFGNVDIFNTLGGGGVPDYTASPKPVQSDILSDPSNNNNQDSLPGSSLHLNIDRENADATPGGHSEFSEPSPRPPEQQQVAIDGILPGTSVPANARQDELSLNPLASSVSTLDKVANNVHKDNMDTSTIGLLNEVFKKLTKMMPKKHAVNGTAVKINTHNNNNNKSSNTDALKGLSKHIGKPNGPSIIKNLVNDGLLPVDKKKPGQTVVNGTKTPPKKPKQAHISTMNALLKQAKKLQMSMKVKDNHQPHPGSSRHNIDSKVKRTSIVREYINILRSDPPECTENQMIKVMQYRTAILQATSVVTTTPNAGCFLVSCIQHSLSLFDETWTGVTVKQKSIQQAFGDWYYNRGTNHLSIDGVYPSNPSCP
eukprot:gene14250-15736_t